MPLRVLVIDDEASVRMTLTALLQWQRYDVETANDGDEGVARAKETKPDVILCDSRMPRVPGRTAVAELRSDSSTAHIPVIIVSGHETKQSANYADGFVPKPFGVAELLAAIRAALTRDGGNLGKMNPV